MRESGPEKAALSGLTRLVLRCTRTLGNIPEMTPSGWSSQGPELGGVVRDPSSLSRPQRSADKGKGLTCGSGAWAGPGLWQRLFGLPPGGMWLGCPAILHASLAAHGATKENAGFLRHMPVHLLPLTALGWGRCVHSPQVLVGVLECRAGTQEPT